MSMRLIFISALGFLFSSTCFAHQANPLPKSVMARATYAYQVARKAGLTDSPIMGIEDLRMHSDHERFCVVNMVTHHTYLCSYAASGIESYEFPNPQFSYRPGSHESEMGLYKTLYPFYGVFGYALKLQGLQRGINDNAFRRAIELHAASYASSDYIEDWGQAGYTWGCIGLDPDKEPLAVKLLKHGKLVYLDDGPGTFRSKTLIH